eukprot:1342949-Prymnesium_polylepis.1
MEVSKLSQRLSNPNKGRHKDSTPHTRRQGLNTAVRIHPQHVNGALEVDVACVGRFLLHERHSLSSCGV